MDYRLTSMKKIGRVLYFIALINSAGVLADESSFNNSANNSTAPEAIPVDDTWILVDTKDKDVRIMENNNPIKVFNHAAFGRGGVGLKRKRGDNVTPKGIYTIGWNNDKSDFRKFFGLTYPSIQDAENGLQQGLINDSEYQAIVKAHLEHKIPPQNTALGGSVGIHGLGAPLRRWKKHLFLNWTEGCVALTNEQIDELAMYVKPGMFVVIN